MIKTVIFDWDGTLHNTKALYGAAFREGYDWLVAGGYAPERFYSDDEAAQFIGMNAVDMWKSFMPSLPDEITAIPRGIIGESMVSNIYAGKALLYEGALEVLETLKKEGYHTAFLSNCRIAYMEAFRKCFGLDRYFDKMYACETFGFASKVEIFKTLSAQLPGEYVMVGDRFSDMEVALTYGFRSIGCAYGFGTAEELSSATAIAKDCMEIPGLVRS